MKAPTEPAAPRVTEPLRQVAADCCPVCGSERLLPLRCKVICQGCRTIVQSCADL